MLPKALKDAIEALGHLPGVGPRTAERYAYFLFKSNPEISKNLADSLSSLHNGVKSCPVTFALIDKDAELSPLYDSPARDKTTILVVEEPLDIYAIESTNSYKGTYHVLGGAISPIDGITSSSKSSFTKNIPILSSPASLAASRSASTFPTPTKSPFPPLSTTAQNYKNAPLEGAHYLKPYILHS